MKKQIKAIPEFANEQEERRFWEKHDSSEYLATNHRHADFQNEALI